MQLAATLDIRSLVRTTYELEGDRLELLLVYDRIEKLRAFGRSIANGADGVLPNLDGYLRSQVKLQKGVAIFKEFPGVGVFKGVLTGSKDLVESTQYPGEERLAWQVKYPSDGTVEDLEEDELRPKIVVKDMHERKEIIQQGLGPMFAYLEARITGTCDAQYSCVDMYELCRVARFFNPSYADSHLTPDAVDALIAIKPLTIHVRLSDLKKELPAYLSAVANAPPISADDVEAFSKSVLDFWRNTSQRDLRACWRRAACIVFSISPNSAGCERVFSLLKIMYGDQLDGSLADRIQVSLMLRYNDRDESSDVDMSAP